MSCWVLEIPSPGIIYAKDTRSLWTSHNGGFCHLFSFRVCSASNSQVLGSSCHLRFLLLYMGDCFLAQVVPLVQLQSLSSHGACWSAFLLLSLKVLCSDGQCPINSNQGLACCITLCFFGTAKAFSFQIFYHFIRILYLIRDELLNHWSRIFLQKVAHFLPPSMPLIIMHPRASPLWFPYVCSSQFM